MLPIEEYMTRTLCTCLALAFALGAGACERNRIAKPADARRQLEELARLAIEYAGRQSVPPLFPTSSDWSPPGRPCAEKDRELPPDPTVWQSSPWRELGFAIAGKTRYQFRLMRIGAGSNERLLVEARGDLNCNSVPSHLVIAIDAKLHRQPILVERENE